MVPRNFKLQTNFSRSNYRILLENHSDMVLVQVEQGTLKGTECCYDEEQYVTFKGIPYATPPLGILRFKAPEPPQPWQGVRDASQHGPVCPQYNERMDRIDEGSEDCLYLNVYSKDINPSQPLPVMVWIHGGSFYTGSGNSEFYGPEFFMAHDVILVTFNYRLEVLGFLCLNTEEVPGNAGLKDQVAALKWVKKNIAAFGGDPNNITIFGCSAGAASASYHLLSKMSEGLFHKAICQSGVCLNDWSYNMYGIERAFQLGKKLGIVTEDPTELLQFLQNAPVSSLINITLPKLGIQNEDLADSIYFGPVIENKYLEIEKFITEEPINLVKSGKISKVPIIVGYTTDGIELGRKLVGTASFLAKIGAVVPRELKLRLAPEKIQEIDKKIRKHYFQGKDITTSMVQEYSDFETDRLFAYNIVRFARYLVKHTSQPAYVYKFAAETDRNFTKKRYKMEAVKGVCHSDELPYFFNITCIDIPLSGETKQLVRRCVQLWVNFALTGRPTYPADELQWKEFSNQERYCFIIDKQCKSVLNENGQNMAFWEDIYGEIEL